MIRIVDTDVVTITVTVIPSIDITELWVAFSTERHLRYIPVHSIALSLGAVRSKVLPMFHAYTGCDTVSLFANREKKTAWDIWKTFDNLTEAFHSVIVDPDTITEEVLSTIERFTVLLYNRTSLQCGCQTNGTVREERARNGGHATNKGCTYAPLQTKCI